MNRNVVAYTNLARPCKLTKEESDLANSLQGFAEGMNVELCKAFGASLRASSKYGYDPEKDFRKSGILTDQKPSGLLSTMKTAYWHQSCTDAV